MRKILRVIWKIIFVIWGLLTTLIIITDLTASLNSVLSGEIKIQNYFLWYLSFIPTTFLLVLLISKVIIKKSNLLKRFVGFLGLLSGIFFTIGSLSLSNFNISLVIVITFCLYVFITSLLKPKHEKSEKLS